MERISTVLLVVDEVKRPIKTILYKRYSSLGIHYTIAEGKNPQSSYEIHVVSRQLRDIVQRHLYVR